MNDTFTDNLDGTVELSVCDNADGQNIIVNLDATADADNLDSVGIALSADQAFALADVLRTYAAGI